MIFWKYHLELMPAEGSKGNSVDQKPASRLNLDVANINAERCEKMEVEEDDGDNSELDDNGGLGDESQVFH
jgi:hypothetical protein